MELCESFHSFKNMEIISESNEKISTSSVLLSMCSQVVCEATKDILRLRTLDLEDKMVVILPDFSSDTIRIFIDYILGETVTFSDAKGEKDMLQLLEMFRLKNYTISEDDEWEEPMDMDGYVDAVLKDNDNLKSEPIAEDNNPISKLKKTFQTWHSKAIPLIDNEFKKSFGTVKCSCSATVTKLPHALKHLRDLTKDWETSLDFKIRSDKKFRCPLCYKFDFKRKTQATSHMRVHIQEIHDNVTLCKLCEKPQRYSTT